jgi:hypothetical protein
MKYIYYFREEKRVDNNLTGPPSPFGSVGTAEAAPVPANFEIMLVDASIFLTTWPKYSEMKIVPIVFCQTPTGRLTEALVAGPSFPKLDHDPPSPVTVDPISIRTKFEANKLKYEINNSRSIDGNIDWTKFISKKKQNIR